MTPDQENINKLHLLKILQYEKEHEHLINSMLRNCEIVVETNISNISTCYVCSDRYGNKNVSTRIVKLFISAKILELDSGCDYDEVLLYESQNYRISEDLMAFLKVKQKENKKPHTIFPVRGDTVFHFGHKYFFNFVYDKFQRKYFIRRPKGSTTSVLENKFNNHGDYQITRLTLTEKVRNNGW